MVRGVDGRGWRAHLTPFDWGALLTAASVAEAALLLLLGLFLTDAETIAFGVVVAATTALLFWRRNRVALLVRFAVFLDVAYWMAPAALTNLGHHSGAGAVIPPLALAITSALGLVATIVSLVPDGRSETRGTVGVVAATVLVLVIGSGYAVVQHTAASGASSDLTISMKSARYSATKLTAKAHAGRVTIHVTNQDLFWHTFTSPELKGDEHFPVKADRTITVTAKPGVYHFFCSIPGHAQIGMKGTVTVK